MNSTNHLASLAPVYRKALKTWRPVILYFGDENCPACEWAEPVFREVAQRYRHHANIYVLSTRESPRHPNVNGTPTVLFFKDGRLRKKLKGIGSRETLEEDFANHVGRLRPQCRAHKPSHDLAWLRQTLRGLCTVPRALERLNCQRRFQFVALRRRFAGLAGGDGGGRVDAPSGPRAKKLFPAPGINPDGARRTATEIVQ